MQLVDGMEGDVHLENTEYQCLQLSSCTELYIC